MIIPPPRSGRPTHDRSHILPGKEATVVGISTATLIGATLRLARRPLTDRERNRLKRELQLRADNGEAAAQLVLDWLARRGRPGRDGKDDTP